MNAGTGARRDDAPQITLSIHGMHCAACVANVERALRSVEGVREAQVNLATEEGRVSAAPGAVEVSELIRAVERAGYRAAPRADTDRVDRERERLQEERANRGRLLLALACGVPLMLVHLLVRDGPLRQWIAFALATPVQLGAAGSFHARTVRGLRHGTVDMNTLISIGTFAAYLFSAAITIAPRTFESLGMGSHVYFDTAVMILIFILLGRLLESRARRRTGDAVKALLLRRPRTARRVGVAGTETVPLEELRREDRLEILPGETLPVDGLVEEGRTDVDESMLTGEPLPVVRGPGDPVAAGTINLTGRVLLRATRVGDATTLAHIVRLVEEAQGSKAPLQALADRVASRFVPAVLALALLAAVAWLVWGPAPAPRYAMLVFVSVLIIACPCAMGLATPTAIMVGTGAGARRGILIRGGDSLERAGRVTAIVFDKTGTLTAGEPRIAALHPAEGVAEAELLRVAAGVERGSEHPHARAVVRRALLEGLVFEVAADVAAVPGQGARGRLGGAEVRVGSRAFACPLGAAPEPLRRLADAAAEAGRAAIWVSRGRQVLGLLEAEDRLRDDAASAVRGLARTVRTLVLATGDRAEPARRLAQAVGIPEVRSGLTPEGKVALVRELQQRGETVAMVGDGLNDAAALAAADLGIAIGSGTDVAVEAADVTLVRGSLSLIDDALDLSRRTVRTIRQNLFWAFAYNVLAIPLAAGALYPFTRMLLHPTIASATMALSSVSVVSNSLRLARWSGAKPAGVER